MDYQKVGARSFNVMNTRTHINISKDEMVRRWGIGLDFRSTEPSRNLFSFFDKEKCIVREGQKARKGGLRGEQEGVFS